jgi:hypothetical protein
MHSAAGGERKRIDEGRTMSPLGHNSKTDPVEVADPRETRSLTPATNNESSDILINSRNLF